MSQSVVWNDIRYVHVVSLHTWLVYMKHLWEKLVEMNFTDQNVSEDHLTFFFLFFFYNPNRINLTYIDVFDFHVGHNGDNDILSVTHMVIIILFLYYTITFCLSCYLLIDLFKRSILIVLFIFWLHLPNTLKWLSTIDFGFILVLISPPSLHILSLFNYEIFTNFKNCHFN